MCFCSMAYYKKTHIKDTSFKCFLIVVLFTLLAVLVLIVSLRTNKKTGSSELDEGVSDTKSGSSGLDEGLSLSVKIPSFSENFSLPKQNELSIRLEKRNRLPPRNINLYPTLAKDHIKIVLYVHNRPQYLQVVVESLSEVVGISETLLIVSHDGYFEEMNKIVEGIKFCQVKQIFAPYSPHLFTDGFPGVSSNDCRDKDDAGEKQCIGNPDQYGNHRSTKIVSLKHHWWWMMNTVWDGLREIGEHDGHILFIEEDHFIFPNAYRNLQLLVSLKQDKCPDCAAANLAPFDVDDRGEDFNMLIAEKIGNVGYAFNRTVWRRIHRKAKEFCFFDEYNWDITMWATVYPSFGRPVYTLRGPRSSAVHIGKCGLHEGRGGSNACYDNGSVNVQVDDTDQVANIRSEWDLLVYRNQPGYKAGFKGWGGWGDHRDHMLCLKFAQMYQ